MKNKKISKKVWLPFSTESTNAGLLLIVGVYTSDMCGRNRLCKHFQLIDPCQLSGLDIFENFEH